MSKLVFITGGTGFIGSHIVATTLAAGYRVRLSIRKVEQADVVKRRFSSYTSQIQTVVIPDITKPESFKEALQGVDYVFHIASPMPGAGSDFTADYVKPALDGTIAILNAALDHSSIKKVIVNSSALAFLPIDALGRQRMVVKATTEDAPAIDSSFPFPDGIPGAGMKYAGSKILAHQATKDWLKTNTPNYVLNTFHATFVLGRDLNQTSAEGLSGIDSFFWNSLFSERPLISDTWVHVLDVADAHVKAIETNTTHGEAFVLSNPATNWDKAVKLLRTKYPDLDVKIVTPLEGGWTSEASEAETVLGLKWRSLESIVSDVVDQQLSFRK